MVNKLKRGKIKIKFKFICYKGAKKKTMLKNKIKYTMVEGAGAGQGRDERSNDKSEIYCNGPKAKLGFN